MTAAYIRENNFLTLLFKCKTILKKICYEKYPEMYCTFLKNLITPNEMKFITKKNA